MAMIGGEAAAQRVAGVVAGGETGAGAGALDGPSRTLGRPSRTSRYI